VIRGRVFLSRCFHVPVSETVLRLPGPSGDPFLVSGCLGLVTGSPMIKGTSSGLGISITWLGILLFPETPRPRIVSPNCLHQGTLQGQRIIYTKRWAFPRVIGWGLMRHQVSVGAR